MRVAVVQSSPAFGETKANVAAALKQMSTVSADLFVLPELFASGYNFASLEEAESLSEGFPDGPTSASLREFANRTQSFVVFGFPEKAATSLYNSAAIIGYDGTEGLYRKIHLFDREKLFFSPGNLPFSVLPTPWGRVGIMICFDWYYPESMRTLALRGAQLVAHPSNLVLPHCPESMKTRCRENRVFAATANRVGLEDRNGHRLTFIGQSQITSPEGDAVFRASKDSPEIHVDTLSLDRADSKSINERNDLFRDRRPEFYA